MLDGDIQPGSLVQFGTDIYGLTQGSYLGSNKSGDWKIHGEAKSVLYTAV